MAGEHVDERMPADRGSCFLQATLQIFPHVRQRCQELSLPLVAVKNRGGHEMVRAFVFAAVAFALVAVAAHDTYAANGWYPFYGYHQPSYLARPCVMAVQPSVTVVQPSAPQVSTAYYPPAPGSAAPAVTVVPQYSSPPQCTTRSGWTPFYGNRRPNLP